MKVCKPKKVDPCDILGAKFFSDQQCWIIYLANIESKAKLVSLGSISIGNKQMTLNDFNPFTASVKCNLQCGPK